MSFDKNKYKKKIQQKRVTRAQNKANAFNDGKINKTGQSYIAGDYSSSASTRGYGLKMNNPPGTYTNDDLKIAKGRSRSNHAKVLAGENPYEVKYVYDGIKRTVPGGTRKDGSKYDSFTSRKRMLSEDEKKAYKKTGSIDVKEYEKKYKPRIMDSYNDKSTKFSEKLNTRYLDGMEVAKRNHEKGKYIGNALHSLGGVAKDFILDPVVDAMRIADSVANVGTSAFAGVLEESKNMMDGTANWKRPLENVKDSLAKSNKTGWGKGLDEHFDDATKRNVEKEIARIKADKVNYTDSHKKKLIKDLENQLTDSKHKMFRTLSGIAGDVSAPFDLAQSSTKVAKGLVGNAVKSGKEMINGTADISVAFKPGHNDRLSKALDKSNIQKRAKKEAFKSNVMDAMTEATGGKLTENAKRFKHGQNAVYDNAMAKKEKVVTVVKNNPATENLGNFLESFLKRNERRINSVDSRYNASDSVNELFGNSNLTNSKTRVNPELPNRNIQKDINSIDGDVYKGDDIDKRVLKYETLMDKLDDAQTDELFDHIQETDPEAYKRIMGRADVLDDQAKLINDQYTRESRNFSGNDISTSLTKADTRARELNQRYYDELYNPSDEDKILNALRDKPTSLNNGRERLDYYKNWISGVGKNIDSGDISPSQIKKLAKDFSSKDVSLNIKREYINDKIFSGTQVIKPSASNDDINSFLRSLSEIATIKKQIEKASKTGKSFNINLSPQTKEFFKIPRGTKLTSDGFMTGYNEYNDMGEFVKDLVNAMSNKAQSLTDDRFSAKFNFMADKIGYTSKSQLENEIANLNKEFKAIDSDKKLKPTEKLDMKLKISEQRKILKDKLNERDKLWNTIRDMDEREFDDYIFSNHGDIARGMDYYKRKNNKNYVSSLDNNRGYKEAVEDVSKEIKHEMRVDKDVQSSDYQFKKGNVQTKDDMYRLDDSTMEFGDGGKLVTENQRVAQEELHKSEIIKSIGMKTPYYKNLSNIPKDKKLNFVELSRHKDGKVILGNIRKVTDKILELDMKTNLKSSSVDRKIYIDEFKEIQKQLRKSGVKDEVWKPRLVEYINHIKSSNPEKVVTPKDSPLEKLGLTINKKRGVKGSKNNAKFMEDLNIDKQYKDNFFIDEYEKALNSNNPKDLLNANHNKIDGDEIAQSGDNIGGVKSNPEIPDDVNPFESGIADNDKDYSELTAKNNREEMQRMIDNTRDGFNDRYGAGKPNSKSIPSDEDYNPLADIYKRGLNTWKKGLTVYNPGWHVQNFFQNKGQNYLGLGVDAFKPQKEARQHLKNLKGKDNKAKNIVSNKTGEVFTPDKIRELVDKYDVVDGLGEEAFTSKGLISGLETKVDNSKFMKKLGESEQTARLHHFLTKLERGSSPEEAVKSVNKYLFDYSHKSNFDQNMTDYVDPFWTFHKSNAKLLGQTAFENPSRLNKGRLYTEMLANDISEDDKTNTPMRDIQSPFKTFTDSKNGDDYDYQYDQNMLPDVEGAFPINSQGFENKMNPLLKLAMQSIEGKGDFGNEIVDGEAGFDQITREDWKKQKILELNPFMNPLIKMLNQNDKHQQKVEDGKQTQETTDKQKLVEFVNYITGNKGKYYRDWR